MIELFFGGALALSVQQYHAPYRPKLVLTASGRLHRRRIWKSPHYTVCCVFDANLVSKSGILALLVVCPPGWDQPFSESFYPSRYHPGPTSVHLEIFSLIRSDVI
jgi:hypothetical protein